VQLTVKRISFPSAATLASASGIAAWEGMERHSHCTAFGYKKIPLQKATGF
jgi:hypothetical protein